jgi:hypothetical protein
VAAVVQHSNHMRFGWLATKTRRVTISADKPEEKQLSATNYLFAGNDKYKLMDLVDREAEGNLPHTILLAPGGKVLDRKSGPCEPLAIRRAIVGYLGRTHK